MKLEGNICLKLDRDNMFLLWGFHTDWKPQTTCHMPSGLFIYYMVRFSVPVASDIFLSTSGNPLIMSDKSEE